MSEKNNMLARIRPNAEWDLIKWGIVRSAAIPGLYAATSWARRMPIDRIGLAILFCLSLLIGFLLFPKKRAKPKSDALAGTLNELIEDCDQIAQMARCAGAQARLLWHFEADARSLERLLVQLWHHWNNAGESLVHPISSVKLDWTDVTKASWGSCIGELRDFKALYSSHIMWVRQEFPGLASNLLKDGYPSDVEYNYVVWALQDHAEVLNAHAKQVWDAGEPIAGLDDKS